MRIGTKLLWVVLASVLIGTVAAINLQQVSAPRDCPVAYISRNLHINLKRDDD